MSDASRCRRRDLRQCSGRVLATLLLLGALGIDPTARTHGAGHPAFRGPAPDGGRPEGHPRWVADVADWIADSQSAAAGGGDAIAAPDPVSCGEFGASGRSILAAQIARPLRLASGGVRGRSPPLAA